MVKIVRNSVPIIFILNLGPSQQGNPNDVEVFKSAMIKLSNDYLEKERQNKGFEFGPQFDLIKDVWTNGTEFLVLICPTEDIINDASAYVIHPSIIDACFQTMLLVKGFEGRFVPKEITRVTILQKPICIEQFYAHTKFLESENTPTCNITLMDSFARPVMIIEKYTTEEISTDKTKVTYENSSFTFSWEQLTPETPAANQVNVWLILKDQNTFAERFSQHVADSKNVYLFDKTPAEFSEVLDEISSKMKGDERLLVINFWPVDCCKYDADMHNFDATHELAFESCLLISQEILKKEALSKNTQLVFVTSGVVTIAEQDRYPTIDTADTFPWSASVFGFRRTMSEEITTPKASVVDLPPNPINDDFHNMVEDLRNPTMEEEVVYRDGVRYANRIRELDPGEENFTKQTSPFTKGGERKPFKMTSMSGQWFLRETSNERIKEKNRIEVIYASPVLQKPWQDLEANDRIAFAGKLCDGHEETQVPLVAGFCKIDDLGSYVKADKCCFTDINSDFTAQQAASLNFPLAMSYHILVNLLDDFQGKKVLIYNQSEVICSIFACVAMSLNIKVVCVLKDHSGKERMKKFENVVVISENEIKVAELNGVRCKDLDAVCLFSRGSTYVTHQIMKHLKPGGRVIIVNVEENVKFNPFFHGKDTHCIITNLGSIIENSKDFSKLLLSCCFVLQSRKLLGRLLHIPQEESSIYDVMNSESKNTAFKVDRDCLHTVSFQPKNNPEKVAFYSLPIDTNGLKDDRTYLVIGGVSGFGFEVAKWMVENGAKTVMCTSRSAPSKQKTTNVQHLEQQTGSRILLRQADVTSSKDMNVIEKELEFLPAVAGIVFTAMVLKDQLLNESDLETCKKVVETKVKGKSFIMSFLSAYPHRTGLKILLDCGRIRTRDL